MNGERIEEEVDEAKLSMVRRLLEEAVGEGGGAPAGAAEGAFVVVLDGMRESAEGSAAAAKEAGDDEGEALRNRVDAAIRRLDVAEASIKSVARELDMNAAYLGRLFKAKCGASLKDYIARERMETAKRLLRETDWKVYEIARRVGYLEVDMFYKRFKLYTGVSANRFRAEAKAAAEATAFHIMRSPSPAARCKGEIAAHTAAR